MSTTRLRRSCRLHSVGSAPDRFLVRRRGLIHSKLPLVDLRQYLESLGLVAGIGRQVAATRAIEVADDLEQLTRDWVF
jgi:hypothetical protein